MFILRILYFVLYFFIKFSKSIFFSLLTEYTTDVSLDEIGKKAIGPIFVKICVAVKLSNIFCELVMYKKKKTYRNSNEIIEIIDKYLEKIEIKSEDDEILRKNVLSYKKIKGTKRRTQRKIADVSKKRMVYNIANERKDIVAEMELILEKFQNQSESSNNKNDMDEDEIDEDEIKRAQESLKKLGYT